MIVGEWTIGVLWVIIEYIVVRIEYTIVLLIVLMVRLEWIVLSKWIVISLLLVGIKYAFILHLV